MDRLEEKHLEFLRLCASQPNKIHESDLPPAELDQMANEGLLIRYGGVKVRYCISKYGVKLVKDMIARKELVDPKAKEQALDYVKSKGYEKAVAEKIVEDHGAEVILKSKSEESALETQREVKIPTNAQGKPEMKFKG